MCLILLAWQAHPLWQLMLAANRDERHARPSTSAAWWRDEPAVFAGQDLVAGGTWLGVTREGRFAALTNHRDLRRAAGGSASRGMLVRDFLTGGAAPVEYLAAVDAERARWPAFNLLVGDLHDLACLSTQWPEGERIQHVTPGIHGLSNAVFDTPWPKVRRGQDAMAAALAADDPIPLLFDALADRQPAADQELPDTGLPLERERKISAAMIVDPEYGTRCATVLLIDHQGHWTCVERSFDAGGRQAGPDAVGES